jgi:hypothetical protein
MEYVNIIHVEQQYGIFGTRAQEGIENKLLDT